jgi:4a-hydroxytetrahydrobiopterin dehydratase
MTELRACTPEEITNELVPLPGWEVHNGRLRRRFAFRTFLRAIAFVNAVAFVAEGAGHHPDITINYNRVTVRLITHSIGAITDRDFALASEISARLASRLIVDPDPTADKE